MVIGWGGQFNWVSLFEIDNKVAIVRVWGARGHALKIVRHSNRARLSVRPDTIWRTKQETSGLYYHYHLVCVAATRERARTIAWPIDKQRALLIQFEPV